MKLNFVFLFCFSFSFYCSLYSQVVEKIEFKGNKKTKLEILNKLARLQIGERLDSVVLQNDIVLLNRLPVCNKSSYSVVTTSTGNYKVTYKIEETNTIIPAVNIWTTTNQQLSYQVGVKEFNFLGENKQIGGFYRYNGFHTFSLNYKDPFFFNKRTGTAATVQSLTSLEPLFFENGSANYKYSNTSVELSAFKNLTVAHKVAFGVNLFKEEYRYVNGDVPSDIPLSLDQTKLLYKVNFDYNRINYEYQYVDGYRSLLYMQYVMPLQENQQSFLIAWNDFYYYKKQKRRGNFATRLRLGIASNDDSPFAPFALDNNLNIRGVGNIIDRGTAVMVLNSEYRYTVVDKKWFSMQTNVFVDAGSWRTAGGRLNELFMIKNARIHPGVGLRFIHKKIYNAVFRIDYGRSVLTDKKEQGLVFGIGQYF